MQKTDVQERYLRRWLAGSPRPPLSVVLWSGLGGAICIAVLLLFGSATELALVIPPFGASCVLAFGLPDSPLAQPRNIIGGHLVTAFVGIACLALFGPEHWVMALAVGLGIMGMQVTGTVHPPAGANPIVVLLAGAGWSFLLTPVLLGAALIVAVAYFYNNRIPGRVYPKP